MITATNTELLVGLKNGRTDAWEHFHSRYQPLLISFAKRLGLNETDAEEAAQEALIAFMTAYREGKYDRSKGRLRTWLSKIARHKVLDMHRRRKHVQLADGEDGSDPWLEVADDHCADEEFEREWQQHVYKAALEEVARHVEPQTMESFRLFVIENWPSQKVAEHLDISADSVFQNKTRVIKRMRKISEFMEQNW